MVGRISRLVWSAFDRIDYAVVAFRLAMVDWLHGPEPPTDADRRRERDRERLREAFPWLYPDQRSKGRPQLTPRTCKGEKP